MTITLSTVTPVYSGEKYLAELVGQLDLLRTRWERENAPIRLLECIFVDDGSIDDSAAVLKGLSQKYPFVRVIELSRNFGQHPATAAGILYASGDWVATLDEDLQHPPHMIETLLRKAVEKQADVVYVHPSERVHGNLIRDLGSRSIKKILSVLTGNKNIEHISSFRLIRGSVARATSSVCSHDTYFDIALTWFTNKIEYISEPLHDERHMQSGASGYTLGKLLSHARRMVLSTHTKVLRAGGLLGLAMFLVSILFSFYLVVNAFFPFHVIEVKGWTSTMTAILFTGGITLFLLGIVLEYVSIVLLHTQGKPVFFVIDREMDAPLRAYFAETGHARSA
ncbi:glycosyltransferase family 2 protein [Desulfovibrio sulfodismutans]|uniref:Glycosyltransferase family 2 protein n=1 Tax=Desulfolutivibrio sulfodismutans TaxID=63561 RepID=A0A7K3NPP1_9BACT|nr:glycosyltransferase family 2 protein [Desulfolutivibrio sulfodismutans]NDY58150.1 glycosyltransferase family 2 protein [Desulfolutivibrio sulfodismutans]QLA14604.1 glycosyltransferase [Desulfolutivibrio sulfodismutans DSM 3696]